MSDIALRAGGKRAVELDRSPQTRRFRAIFTMPQRRKVRKGSCWNLRSFTFGSRSLPLLAPCRGQ